jgi:hypothetical protein
MFLTSSFYLNSRHFTVQELQYKFHALGEHFSIATDLIPETLDGGKLGFKTTNLAVQDYMSNLTNIAVSYRFVSLVARSGAGKTRTIYDVSLSLFFIF